MRREAQEELDRLRERDLCDGDGEVNSVVVEPTGEAPSEVVVWVDGSVHVPTPWTFESVESFSELNRNPERFAEHMEWEIITESIENAF